MHSQATGIKIPTHRTAQKTCARGRETLCSADSAQEETEDGALSLSEKKPLFLVQRRQAPSVVPLKLFDQHVCKVSQHKKKHFIKTLLFAKREYKNACHLTLTSFTPDWSALSRFCCVTVCALTQCACITYLKAFQYTVHCFFTRNCSLV